MSSSTAKVDSPEHYGSHREQSSNNHSHHAVWWVLLVLVLVSLVAVAAWSVHERNEQTQSLSSCQHARQSSVTQLKILNTDRAHGSAMLADTSDTALTNQDDIKSLTSALQNSTKNPLFHSSAKDTKGDADTSKAASPKQMTTTNTVPLKVSLAQCSVAASTQDLNASTASNNALTQQIRKIDQPIAKAIATANANLQNTFKSELGQTIDAADKLISDSVGKTTDDKVRTDLSACIAAAKKIQKSKSFSAKQYRAIIDKLNASIKAVNDSIAVKANADTQSNALREDNTSQQALNQTQQNQSTQDTYNSWQSSAIPNGNAGTAQPSQGSAITSPEQVHPSSPDSSVSVPELPGGQTSSEQTNPTTN